MSRAKTCSIHNVELALSNCSLFTVNKSSQYDNSIGFLRNGVTVSGQFRGRFKCIPIFLGWWANIENQMVISQKYMTIWLLNHPLWSPISRWINQEFYFVLYWSEIFSKVEKCRIGPRNIWKSRVGRRLEESGKLCKVDQNQSRNVSNIKLGCDRNLEILKFTWNKFYWNHKRWNINSTDMESDTTKPNIINSNGGKELLKQLLPLSKSVMVSHHFCGTQWLWF